MNHSHWIFYSSFLIAIALIAGCGEEAKPRVDPSGGNPTSGTPNGDGGGYWQSTDPLSNYLSATTLTIAAEVHVNPDSGLNALDYVYQTGMERHYISAIFNYEPAMTKGEMECRLSAKAGTPAKTLPAGTQLKISNAYRMSATASYSNGSSNTTDTLNVYFDTATIAATQVAGIYCTVNTPGPKTGYDWSVANFKGAWGTFLTY